MANDVKLENTYTTEPEIEACEHIEQCWSGHVYDACPASSKITCINDQNCIKCLSAVLHLIEILFFSILRVI